MKEDFEKLLALNIEINTFLKAKKIEFSENFSKMLEDKNLLIETLKSHKNSSEKDYTELKNSEMKETWEKIQKLEKENLELINSKKELLTGEINKLKNNFNAISSYKFKKELEPRLFDDSL